MTLPVLSLILLSVLLTSIAQITLKAGMNSQQVQEALAEGFSIISLKAIAANMFVICGLSIYFLSAFFWLIVLSKVDVSIAYPFVSIGFIFTMIAGALFFGEPITIGKIAGTSFVAIGVVIVATGRY